MAYSPILCQHPRLRSHGLPDHYITNLGFAVFCSPSQKRKRPMHSFLSKSRKVQTLKNFKKRHRRYALNAATRYTLEQLESRLLLSTTNSWQAAGGGDWDTAANWSLGHVPTASEDAIIGIASTNVITHSNNVSDAVNSITSTAGLNLTNGTLAVTTTAQVGGVFTLNGATLSGATVTGNTTLHISTSASSTLTGVTVASGSTLDAANASDSLNVRGGLTLNGTFNLGQTTSANSFATITFLGSQHLSGSGTVNIGVNTASGISPYPPYRIFAESTNGGTTPAVLTIDSGMTINGGTGSLSGYFSSDSIVNNGTVQAPASGAALYLGGAFTNAGTISSTNAGLYFTNLQNQPGASISTTGGTFSLSGTWNNAGTITSSNSTVNLGGTFTLANLGTFNRSGGTVNVTGTLNNTGTTLA